jgi:hypothetical protein
MSKNIIYIIVGILFSSCIVINTPEYTPGFYSGYSELTEQEKNNIVFTEPDFDICNLQNDGKIYSITGTQLQNCILKQPKSLVYIWSPHCSSENCYSLDLMQAFCEKNGFTFFVISEYYDSEMLKVEITKLKQYPMFSINEKYYKTRYCNRYSMLFVKDLLSDEIFKKDYKFNRYFIFENGKLQSTSFKIE